MTATPAENVLLVANRGEIAVRVLGAASEAGLHTVAVFTREERDDVHVRLADEAHQLPGDGPAAYLDAEALLAVAAASGAGLLHPGYGFLSEDAAFARACAAAGVTFVGPDPGTLELFGDKAAARAFASGHGIPVPAATPGGIDAAAAQAFADETGDIVLKAVSGGGGRGMRVVLRGGDVAAAHARAASEARAAFGRGELYAEAYIARARHLEVQILADGLDAAVLGDRDCTVQRRHQKVVELAPAPALPSALRVELADRARRMALACGYRGLLTVEYLLDLERGEAFFIEGNPRLQVEHTVTEEASGLDLVALQLAVARGESLAGLRLPASVPPRASAAQIRLTAQGSGPGGTVVPTHGRVEVFEPPTGPGVRVDTWIESGTRVGGAFDPLLAKVVARVPGTGDAHVAAALRKAQRALGRLRLDGVETDAALVSAALAQVGAPAGPDWTTSWLDEHHATTTPTPSTGAPGRVTTHLTGTVVQVFVSPGDRVTAGADVAVVEAMKMEHVITAAAAGVVGAVRVGPGDAVTDGDLFALVDVDADDQQGAGEGETGRDLDAPRADLEALQSRRLVRLDEARPDAVASRHAAGRRTARENVADLLDPDSFVEYGGLAVAAQRRRRSLEELVATTPADGIVTGVGRVGADRLGPDASRVAVLAYDATVLAGTQGYLSHKKTDRLLALAHEQRLPIVLYAEGGGGRPGDTDTTVASGLDVPTFTRMAALSGRVPSVGIAAGRCFAGNAALLGCCDVVIATRDSTIGMGGPAMIAGGGLGEFRPEEVGPLATQVAAGVVDIAVEDEAEATAVARRYLGYAQDAAHGVAAPGDAPDARLSRHVVPENRMRAYRVREAVEAIVDVGSVLELRAGYAPGAVTALARIEGRPVAVIANNPEHLGGAIDGPAADAFARFLRLADAYGMPVLSLCDTPGFMVGPEHERTGIVRRFAKLFVTGAGLRVPLATVVLRKAYGLGAQAMAGGAFCGGAGTVAWPTGEVGGMGLEGAVRLGYRRELAAQEDPAARQELFDRLLAELYERGRAVNAAAVAELDDVIDPAATRTWVSSVLFGAPLPPRRPAPVDPW